jgi:hypothetical protein
MKIFGWFSRKKRARRAQPEGGSLGALLNPTPQAGQGGRSITGAYLLVGTLLDDAIRQTKKVRTAAARVRSAVGVAPVISSKVSPHKG